MTLQGSLDKVDLPYIVELALEQEQPTAIIMETPQGQWTIFVAQSRVVHVQSPTHDDSYSALMQALLQRQGTFRLEPGKEAPEITIQEPWNIALLKILQRIDEQGGESVAKTSFGTYEPATSSQEGTPMSKPKKTREQIAEILTELLDESADIIGAAVVGVDGLIYSANFPRRDADQNLIAASAAAVYGLSERTMKQIHEGSFVQTLIQGTGGYLLVRSITSRVLFVGVLPSEANLGMAFAETRTITTRLSQILQKLS